MAPFILKVLLILPILLLYACSPAARYIVVSEDLAESSGGYLNYVGQRFVCLSQTDARNNSGLLSLRTQSDIEDYERTRTDRQDPVEHLLLHLIREEYSKAREVLHDQESMLPTYLRLMLVADLAYEEAGRNRAQVSQLVKQYQDAYDVQPCAVSREIIKLRIRQVRYSR